MYRIAIYLCLALLAVPLAASSKPAPVDRDYLSALAVADRFLMAYQTQDQETAILLLSDHLREPAQEDRLQMLFSAPPESHSAYEICRGRKLAPGRYEFPIILFRVAAASPKWQHPHASTLIVASDGKNDWVVEKLP